MMEDVENIQNFKRILSKEISAKFAREKPCANFLANASSFAPWAGKTNNENKQQLKFKDASGLNGFHLPLSFATEKPLLLLFHTTNTDFKRSNHFRNNMTTPSSNQTLQNCTNSLSQSVSLLANSLETLKPITLSFANLNKTLTIQQIFTLVPESDIISTQQNIRAEIEPRINKLMAKIKHKVEKAERQRDTMTTKVRRNDLRISQLRKTQERRATGQQVILDEDEEMQRQKLRELQAEKLKLRMELSSFNLNRTKLNFRGSFGMNSSIPSGNFNSSTVDYGADSGAKDTIGNEN